MWGQVINLDDYHIKEILFLFYVLVSNIPATSQHPVKIIKSGPNKHGLML